MKKVISLVLSILLVAALCVPALGAETYTYFPDVPDSHWAVVQGGIPYVKNNGIMQGVDSAGNFAPSNTLSRAEFITMIARVLYPAEAETAKANQANTANWWDGYYQILFGHDMIEGADYGDNDPTVMNGARWPSWSWGRFAPGGRPFPPPSSLPARYPIIAPSAVPIRLLF